jgi:hypothetical protein
MNIQVYCSTTFYSTFLCEIIFPYSPFIETVFLIEHQLQLYSLC